MNYTTDINGKRVIAHIEESCFWIKAITIISLLLIIPAFSFAQDFILLPNVSNVTTTLFERLYAYDSKLKIDSVAFEGTGKCFKWRDTSLCWKDTSVSLHDWVDEPNEYGIKLYCNVLHDVRGCPDQWPRYWRICRDCLRKEHVREERTLREKQKSEFELLNEKVKLILNEK